MQRESRCIKAACKQPTWLIAAAVDGNQQVLPLAFAVVDDESTSSWKWFLTLLSRHVIRGRRGVCLISDRHPGIIKAVREGSDFVSPHGAHRYCLRHVCSNFNTRFKNVILKDLCWRAGSEYQIRKFNRIMEEIKSQNIAVFEFLDQINKEKWTGSHDGGWGTGILTTNMSECINGVLKGARRLPLTAVVEITLVRTVNYFVTRERRSHAMVANGQLWTDFAYKMFNQWHQKSIDHTVTKYNHRHSPHRLLQNASRDLDSILMLSKSTIENVHAVSGLNLAFLVHTLKKYALHTILMPHQWLRIIMMFKLTRIHILRFFNHCIRKIIGMPQNFSWSMIRLFVSLHVQVEIKHHVFITRWIGGKRVKGSKLNKEKILQDSKSVGVGLYTIIVFLHF
ncbi:UNVERIFIED_CONTAM: hypothetical protein Sradi_0755400 [Sesamum radiatum]|uniref:MULE transposase domain-containing protein n=1 Tax=Sesamum radiatum TaxID=300843 RepID=A0AAW2VQL2_SESRA